MHPHLGRLQTHGPTPACCCRPMVDTSPSMPGGHRFLRHHLTPHPTRLIDLSPVYATPGVPGTKINENDQQKPTVLPLKCCTGRMNNTAGSTHPRMAARRPRKSRPTPSAGPERPARLSSQCETGHSPSSRGDALTDASRAPGMCWCQRYGGAAGAPRRSPYEAERHRPPWLPRLVVKPS